MAFGGDGRRSRAARRGAASSSSIRSTAHAPSSRGDPRWAVSAALIVDGRPVAGVVYAPALDEIYSAARGAGAELNGVRDRASARADWSRLDAAGPKPIVQCDRARDSAPRPRSRRACPRSPIDSAWRRGERSISRSAAEHSHDWDIAAADLLLEEAGARLVDESGERLVYNTKLVRRPALLATPRSAGAWIARRLSRRDWRATETAGRRALTGDLRFCLPRGQSPALAGAPDP